MSLSLSLSLSGDWFVFCRCTFPSSSGPKTRKFTPVSRKRVDVTTATPSRGDDDGVSDEALAWFDNADRKQFGLSLIGRCFGDQYKRPKNWKPK